MPTDLSTLPPICQHCILRKQKKRVVPKTRQWERAKGLLDVVNANLTGPEAVASAGRTKYLLMTCLG